MPLTRGNPSKKPFLTTTTKKTAKPSPACLTAQSKTERTWACNAIMLTEALSFVALCQTQHVPAPAHWASASCPSSCGLRQTISVASILHHIKNTIGCFKCFNPTLNQTLLHFQLNLHTRAEYGRADKGRACIGDSAVPDAR